MQDAFVILGNLKGMIGGAAGLGRGKDDLERLDYVINELPFLNDALWRMRRQIWIKEHECENSIQSTAIPTLDQQSREIATGTQSSDSSTNTASSRTDRPKRKENPQEMDLLAIARMELRLAAQSLAKAKAAIQGLPPEKVEHDGEENVMRLVYKDLNNKFLQVKAELDSAELAARTMTPYVWVNSR